MRLVASKETRIRRMMDLRKCDWAAAEEMIGLSDTARRRFVKTNFGTDIDDPHTYDLVINTDRLSPAAVAVLVHEGLKQRHSIR